MLPPEAPGGLTRERALSVLEQLRRLLEEREHVEVGAVGAVGAGPRLSVPPSSATGSRRGGDRYDRGAQEG
jgi:hypothetical protein